MEIIGYSSYDNSEFLPMKDEEFNDKMIDMIVDDIKKNGYFYTGEDQQDNPDCCPVFSNYRIMRFSRRGFGFIMARACGYEDKMAYSLFMDRFMINSKKKKFPDGKSIPMYNEKGENIRKEEKTIKIPPEDYDNLKKSMQNRDEDSFLYSTFYYLPIPYNKDDRNYFWTGDRIFVTTEKRDEVLEYRLAKVLATENINEITNEIENFKTSYKMKIYCRKKYIEKRLQKDNTLVLVLV